MVDGGREEQLRRLAAGGVWDPDDDPGGHRRALVEAMLARGASVAEMLQHAEDLGDLATDLVVRPRADMISLVDAAEAAGVDLDQALAVWRALGFTETDPRRPSLTPGEARLVALQDDMSNLLGQDVTLQLLRTMSTGLARLAHAERDALRIEYEVARVSAGAPYVEIVGEYWRIVEEVLPRLEQALAAVHRRHLVVAARQDWSTDEAGTTATATLAVGFADLVGFTERSERLTTTELAAAVTAFDALAHDVVHEHGGHVVKLIGDEVMFTADDAATGVRVACALATHQGAAALLPPLRVGLAHGEVITRDGDYFGRVVNLASRLVDEAAPGEVLVSGPTAEVVRTEADLTLSSAEAIRAKGFIEPQAAWRVATRAT